MGSTRQLPTGNYVDNVKTIEYNLDYGKELTDLSLILKATYDDGTVLNINLYNLEDSKMSGLDVRHAIAHGYMGPGNRVFPLHMNRSTTPQLWRAREEAVEMMAESNINFMLFSFNIVWLVLSFPAMPAGAPPAEPAITRRVTPRPRPAQPQTPTPEKPVTPKQPPEAAPPAPNVPDRIVVGRGKAVGRSSIQDPQGMTTKTLANKSAKPDLPGLLENAPKEYPGMVGKIKEILLERLGLGFGLKPAGITAARKLLQPGGTLKILEKPTGGRTLGELETQIRAMLPTREWGNITVTQHVDGLLVTATKL